MGKLLLKFFRFLYFFNYFMILVIVFAFNFLHEEIELYFFISAIILVITVGVLSFVPLKGKDKTNIFSNIRHGKINYEGVDEKKVKSYRFNTKLFVISFMLIFLLLLGYGGGAEVCDSSYCITSHNTVIRESITLFEYLILSRLELIMFLSVTQFFIINIKMELMKIIINRESLN